MTEDTVIGKGFVVFCMYYMFIVMCAYCLGHCWEVLAVNDRPRMHTVSVRILLSFVCIVCLW